MCFSATASFVGGALISGIGIASIRSNNDPDSRVFAAIPIVFGVQQIAEGFVWIALKSTGQNTMLMMAESIFLTIAVIIWPTLVPLSVLLMERLPKRRAVMKILLAMGIVVSLSHVIGLIIFNVQVQISGYHILYSMDTPSLLAKIISVAYVVATVPVFFITSKKRVYLFGIIITLSFAVAQLLYMAYLVSVWCFFAALSSAVILWIVKEPILQKEIC